MEETSASDWSSNEEENNKDNSGPADVEVPNHKQDVSKGLDDIVQDTTTQQEDENKEHTDVKNFRKEVIESITRGIEQGVLKDNLVLEINGSKHAWNTNLSEVNQCVLFSVLTANVALDSPELTPQTLLAAVLKNINKLSQLLLHYSK